VTIGSLRANDIALDSRSVSRRQLALPNQRCGEQEADWGAQDREGPSTACGGAWARRYQRPRLARTWDPAHWLSRFGS